jgi:cytochrome b involved in lipid metabolism
VELIEAILLFFHKKQGTVLTTTKEEDRFTHTFPSDIHVHIASFLHPKDITNLSCVSKSYNEVVSNSETSKQIWRSLWMRDFSWLLTNWDVGIQALRRSNVGPNSWERMDKTFYFMFRQTYVNWIIAGENTMRRCLVGLHGNIYDISSFLNAHPGSPDTLMVHSGQDATRFFEDINHSNGARRLAKSLCVVLDLSSTSEEAWGVQPTSFAKLSNPPKNIIDPGNPLLLGRKERKGQATLSSIKERIKEERKQVERRITRKYASDLTVLGGQVNTYYDAFRREWRVWYTDSDLQNVFAPA